MDLYQHADCLGNPHFVPPWYDLPPGADPETHNPWLITDSSTKQTPWEIFVKRIGDDELRKRVAEFRERLAGLPEGFRH